MSSRFFRTRTQYPFTPYFLEKWNTTDSFGGIFDLHTCKVHHCIFDQILFKQPLNNLVPVRAGNIFSTRRTLRDSAMIKRSISTNRNSVDAQRYMDSLLVKRSQQSTVESALCFLPNSTCEQISQQDRLTLDAGRFHLSIPTWPHTGFDSKRRE